MWNGSVVVLAVTRTHARISALASIRLFPRPSFFVLLPLFHTLCQASNSFRCGPALLVPV